MPVLCAAGERASAASGAAPASLAGPALAALRLKVAPLADLGAGPGRQSGPAPVASASGQRQWRRELRPRRHRLATDVQEQNSTRPTSAERTRVRPSLGGLPYRTKSVRPQTPHETSSDLVIYIYIYITLYYYS